MLSGYWVQVAIVVYLGKELEKHAVLQTTAAPRLVDCPERGCNILHPVHASPDFHVLPKSFDDRRKCRPRIGALERAQ